MVHQAQIRLAAERRDNMKAIVPAMAFSFNLRKAFSLLPAVLILLLSACNQSDLKEPLIYDGPLQILENVELYYTEDNVVKVKMIAATVYEHENGDREFPKGIYLEFYDGTGKLESTLRANEAFFFKKENQWRGRGKVEVKNLAKNEQLNTEELFWKPSEEKIFTDKFVTIRQQNDVIYGQGLEAKQDMSDYIIKKPEGEFAVED
jgi:LPS export ABC transporter protein LptC